MYIQEVAASLYAWDLADEGIERIAGTLQERSLVNCLYLVGVMHYEKRPLTSLFYTHNPVRKYYLPENSRVYYRLDPASFKNTRLKPRFSQQEFLAGTDWLDVLTQEARRRGMKAGIELSHTIFDTDIARSEFPDTLQVNVEGEPINAVQGMLCPNHPDVHEYQRAMFYDTVKNHDVDLVQTCLLTFAEGSIAKAPWFFEPWMDIEHPSLGALLGLANGGCFCKHCQEKANRLGYDWERMVRDVKKLRRVAGATPYRFQQELMENNLTLGSNVSESLLLIEYPGLLDFIRFRIDSITELFRDIYESVHEAKPEIDFRYNNHVRLPEYTGISFKHIAPYLDSVRDSDYSEQTGAKDGFVYKRNTLFKIRRGIGFDRKLIAALASRPNATPELIRQSIRVMSETGVDGISLGHYDGAHMEHLDAVGQGIREAGIEVRTE
ncbi:MAG: hypothetical protein HFG26_08655 [Provencibacterium sp.]|jgi:hypothetical protein|nr:hypothetical protein [Provencibacterium sp.]